MIRSRISLCLAVSLVVGTAAAGSPAPVNHVPKANTRAAIQAYVRDAARLIATNGPSCESFASPVWRSGDYYIFVDGKTICHPDPAVVGKSINEIVSSKGDKVGEKISKASLTASWTDYPWKRPGQKVEEPKSTYAMRAKGPDGTVYLVGSGGWNLK
jgi:hypothetical protein